MLTNTRSALAEAAGFGFSPVHSPTALSMAHHVYVHQSPAGTSSPPEHPAAAMIPTVDQLVVGGGPAPASLATALPILVSTLVSFNFYLIGS